MSKSTPSPAAKPVTDSPPKGSNPAMQGEGNYEAAKRVRESTETFIAEGKVAPAAKAAKPEDAETAKALKEAESEGKSHAKR